MPNWSGAGSGALTGAGAGAAFGPVGAGIGAGVGGLLGFLSGGSGGKLNKIDNLTPGQKNLHNQNIDLATRLGMQGGGYEKSQNYYNSLLEPGNQGYQNFAAPHMAEFEEEILPMIAERFAGRGALSSSAFGQTLGAAGAGLQAKLASLFESLRSQAAGALTNQYNQLSSNALGKDQFAYERPETSVGFGGQFLSSLAEEAGQSGIKNIKNLFKPKTQGGIAEAPAAAPAATGNWITNLF